MHTLYFTVLTLSSTSAVLAAVPVYGQCGGKTYTGDTACASGNECKAYNDWYSQCVPGSSGSGNSGSAPAASSSAAAAPAVSSGAAAIPVENATTSAAAALPTTLQTVAASSIVVTESTAASVAAPSGTTAADTKGTGANGANCALDAAFKAKGKKYVGVAADSGTLSDTTNAQIIKDNFGQVTPLINSMKWDATEATQGKFTFTGSDALVSFATTNSKLVRGHTTVWHSQLPTWVSSITDKTTLTNVMNTHIEGVIGQYKGKVYAWDVVNEIFNEDGSFRSSVFYNVLGEDFVATAFKTARAADSAAKLYINDYNLDSHTYAKTKAMATNVAKWVAAGVPIDGIGSQSHLSGVWPISDYPEALKLLCAAASECAITELDIKGAAVSDYKTAFQGCLDVDNCVGVTVWGVSDKDSWIQGSNPLLFDSSFQAKDAYNGLCDIL